jgi:dTDP-4-dehydrorhamnose reductase
MQSKVSQILKILILGSSGMLGRYLIEHFELSARYEVFTASRTNADYYCNFEELESLQETIQEIKPDIVINSVAVTSLAQCEAQKDYSFIINGDAPIKISAFCLRLGIKFIQVSSDHFFAVDDGIIEHREESDTVILNHYARTKYHAEQGILSNNPHALVIRTAILGQTNSNRSLLDWMMENMLAHQKVHLLFYVMSSCIHCRDFCNLLDQLIQSRVSGLINIGTDEVFSYGQLYLDIAERLSITPIYEPLDNLEDGITRSTNRGLSIQRLKTLLPQKKIPTYQGLLDRVEDEYRI